MTNWNLAELATIDSEQELTLAPESGGRSVIIWMVSADNRLFVRAVNGLASPWYQAAKSAGKGTIHCGASDTRVEIAEPMVDATLTDLIDDAYRIKYQQYVDDYLPPVMTDEAKIATLEFSPGN